MRKTTVAALVSFAGILGLLAPAAYAGTKFALDGSHTSVTFAVRHMVVSTVRGSFGNVSGEIYYDETNPAASWVKVEIDVNSINTNNERRDGHLKSADFFDAAKYPKITFESTAVEKQGDRWIARGNLTIKGVTKPIEIPFRLNGPIKDPWGNLRLGVDAEPIKINRQDFGVTWNQVLDTGGLAVGDEVTIQISAEATAKAE
ncbi:MAG: YceI family protein [Acidobacteriota bacterium]